MSLVLGIAVFGAILCNGASYHPMATSASVLNSSEILRFDEFDDLLNLAADLYQQRKYDAALSYCLKASEIRPDHPKPYFIAGAIYMAQWKMKNASESFAKAISFAPSDKKLYELKARADRFRNAKEEGLIAARKAIELDPNYAEAYAILGELLSVGDSDHKAAIVAYRTALKLKPEMHHLYAPLGMLYSLNKDEKGAEDIYRMAMEVDPDKMASRFELGRLLVKQGRLAEARTLWDGRKSDKDNTYPNFITLLERAEKRKEAEETLAKKPNDPEALLQMGLMVMDGESWVVDGRQERAIVYFRKALKLKPGFAKAQYAICKAYVEVADIFKEKNRELDTELIKLRKLDLKLAKEIVEYRKTYSGGLKTISVSPNQ